MSEDLGYWVIVVSLEPVLGFVKVTYHIPIKQICTVSDAEDLASEVSEKLPNVLTWHIIGVSEKEYLTYHKLADLHYSIYNFPKLSLSPMYGRNYDLEEEVRKTIKKKYIGLMSELGLDYTTETVIGILELFRYYTKERSLQWLKI